MDFRPPTFVFLFPFTNVNQFFQLSSNQTFPRLVLYCDSLFCSFFLFFCLLLILVLLIYSLFRLKSLFNTIQIHDLPTGLSLCCPNDQNGFVFYKFSGMIKTLLIPLTILSMIFGVNSPSNPSISANMSFNLLSWCANIFFVRYCQCVVRFPMFHRCIFWILRPIYSNLLFFRPLTWWCNPNLNSIQHFEILEWSTGRRSCRN
jgi:hypothetical protein